MKKSSFYAIFLAVAVCLGGCTANERARAYGGEATIALPKGKKLVNITFKGTDIWVLTRDAGPSDVATTHEFVEHSTFGILQGKITIKETL